jgi:hypothetical protein
VVETATGKSTPLTAGSKVGMVLAGPVDAAAGSVAGDGMWGAESGGAGRMFVTPRDAFGRGSRSSAFRLNLSAFCGTGVHVGVV